jgi:PTS system mannose-specific IIA component
MISVLIATHGELSKGLLNGAELIIGKQNNIATLGLSHEDSIEEFEKQVKELIENLDDGSGVLVLVDVFGGSPCNISLKLMQNKAHIAITGVNMPMLLEVLSLRSNCNDIRELSEKALSAGVEGIKDIRKQFENLL